MTWGISKPACLPKASHHLLNICSVILFILVPCAFCTTAQPQLATAETGYHLHWLDVIVAVCMQASAVCTGGLPVLMSDRSHWQEGKHYAMYTTSGLPSPAFSSCARAWKKSRGCNKRHLSRPRRVQATAVLADEQVLTTPSWLLHSRR